MKKLLVICGPTATGKTSLAIELAKKFDGELVSADSRQVYRGMDIGTGKDIRGIRSQSARRRTKVKSVFKDKEYELVNYLIEGIPLWMYDILDPDEEFSVSHYQTLASGVIEDIWDRGKLPIVVGGTGLYIQSLIHGIETSYIPRNEPLRVQLAHATLQELQEKLTAVAPHVFASMNGSDRQNPRRLVRKIEIALTIGLSPQTRQILKNMIDTLAIGLTAPKSTLYERIDKRVDERMKDGLVDEITELINKGYTFDLSSMSGLGYKEWREYFSNFKSQTCLRRQVSISNGEKEKIIQQWKNDEHAYARRQMTWFRKQSDIQWYDITIGDFINRIEAEVRAWYTK